MEWTSEAIDVLRGLWAEGHSTAEIGRRMGVSKNAVVGKAHRLNLPARPSPIRRESEAPAATVAAAAPPQPAPRMAPPPRPAAPAVAREPAPPRPTAPVAASPATPPRPPVAAPPPVAPRAPVLRTFPRAGARSCCWPIGEPGTSDFRFCTAEALTAKPYCAEHASVAYVRARDRREDAA
ncbi:GcrA cell cycle regulator [Acetobacteraceae bacterium H6797]|nr:GcrA cell cycle regulator [Acetobacteraceae bacterium H6797]